MSASPLGLRSIFHTGLLAGLSLAAAETIACDFFARQIAPSHLGVSPDKRYLAMAILIEITLSIAAAPLVLLIAAWMSSVTRRRRESGRDDLRAPIIGAIAPGLTHEGSDVPAEAPLAIVLLGLTVWSIVALGVGSVLLIVVTDVVFAVAAFALRRSFRWQNAIRSLGPLAAACAVLIPLELVTRLDPPFSGKVLYAAIIVPASLAALALFAVAIPTRAAAPFGWSLVSLLAATSLALPPQRLPLPSDHAAGDPQNRPDVLLVTLDTTRADHVGAYGYARNTTPNLDAFAKRSVLFEEAISPADITLSSHASIFTGLPPHRHGAVTSALIPKSKLSGAPLPPGIPTLAALLARHGYTAIGVVANHAYLSRWFGLGRGFDIWDDRIAPPFGCDSTAVRCAFVPEAMRFAPLIPGYRQAGEITSVGEDAASRVHGPLFLFVNYMDAHVPYLPPAPFDRRFGTGCAASARLEGLAKSLVVAGRPMPADVKEQLVNCYDGGIAAMDASVPSLIAAMRSRGRPLMVVITSDHGEMFGEHNLYEHCIGTYRATTHVPLIISVDGPVTANGTLAAVRKSAGTRVLRPVSTTDLFATILAAAGVSNGGPVAESFDLFHPGTTRTVVTAESYPTQLWTSIAPQLNRRTALVFDGRHEWIRVFPGGESIYDVVADPSEEHDLVNDPGSASLRARLRAAAPPLLAVDSTKSATGNPELRRRLRSLGYLR